MKKMNLFLAIAGMCAATHVAAQVDVTPANWKFDNMQRGSADQLFLREASAIGGNFKAPVWPDGRKGYRWADNLPGILSVAHWTDGSEATYDAMTEEQKANLEGFYNAFRIVDGGEMGNILIYQGINSEANDLRAHKNTESMASPNIFLTTDYKTLGGSLGIYKVSIASRIIVNDGKSVDMNVLIGDSWWNGVPLAGSGGSGYGEVHLIGEKDINDFWTLYEFEVEVKNNTDPLFDFWPLLIKFGFGGAANEALIMFDDFKIQKMPSITLGGEVKITDVDWNDTPTNIANIEKEENPIVLINDNGIQIIDAKNTIEVYNAGGQLIEKVEPTSTITSIAINRKGVYMVKTGKSTQKIIF